MEPLTRVRRDREEGFRNLSATSTIKISKATFVLKENDGKKNGVGAG